MTRYSKIISSLTNVGVLVFTYYTLPNSYDALNQCENLWSISLGSSFINYPKTTEWQLRVLQYIKEQKNK